MSKKGIPFEQIFIEQAFSYSVEDNVENTDKMLRSLKGLLVQKKIGEKIGEKTLNEYLGYLDTVEHQPIDAVDKDIYSICDWLRSGIDEIILWNNQKPGRILKIKKVKEDMRYILNELNSMTGELSDILDMRPTFTTSKKFSWPAQQGGNQDEA